ncbi:DUF423 domain-containing protein [Aureimonas psammosilenae]|uniref:DUF423 domain-containing protein n=1 Tax=Aureimonas psammosilenae TaxID=2495496 RepID=UPI001260D9E2|nr:DUF423 domain-containing protein [Aureimonas psammosilenae]
MKRYSTVFLGSAAGFCGACGVAMSAVAAHGTGDSRLIATGAGMALVHAPALLALATIRPERLRLAPLAGLFLFVGVVLFSGDLAKRFFFGERLFEGAAPAGGMAMIAGWLIVTVGAIVAGFSAARTGENG